MPHVNKVSIKMPIPKAFTEHWLKVGTEIISEWCETVLLKETQKEAPIYSGPDPNTQYHPRGLIRKELGIITQQIPGYNIKVKLVGFPNASNNPSDPGTQARIATFVLHLGWNAPKGRLGHQVFAVWRDELRNPRWADASPPPGVQPNEQVAWINVGFTRPQQRIRQNRFFIRAAERSAPALELIKTQKIKASRRTKIPTKRIEKVKR